MISIHESVRKKLLENPIHREIIIKFPDDDIADIGSENIIADSFELTQSICDGDFELGGCIAGRLSVKVVNVEVPLNNKRINVFIKQKYGSGDLTPAANLLPSETLCPGMQAKTFEHILFCGTIESSLRQKNRSVKEIIAYDDFYLMSRLNCKDWVSQYVARRQQAGSNITLGNFTDALLDQLDLAVGRDIPRQDMYGFSLNMSSALPFYHYINDVHKLDEALSDKVTALDMFKACCELNGTFGIIDDNGTIGRVSLVKITGQVTSKKPVDETITSYADLTFEEYVTRNINKLRFKYNKNQNYDYTYNASKESWYIADNIITKCCTSVGELLTNFYKKIDDTLTSNYIFGDILSYRPFTADVFARWWLEPGDKIAIKTGYNDTETVESFVLSRTLKGINGMRCIIKATGTEFLGKDEISSG